MSSSAAKSVSAIFAILFAYSPLVTASYAEPAPPDKCLSGPKGAPPVGGHWYYRVDRATKRACWYIGEAKQKISRAAPETPPASSSAPPPRSAGTQPAIDNARAELPLPQARVEPDADVFKGQRTVTAIPGAINPGIDQRPNTVDAGAQSSVVASRWPELAGVVSTPARPESSIDQSATTQRADSTAELPASAAATPAALSALPLAVAAAASTEKPAGSVQMLLIVILGAVALAGLLASAIFRFGGPRRTGRHARRAERRVNWDSVRADRPSLSDQARAVGSEREAGLLPEAGLVRDLRAADDPDQRIAHMLSRLPRSAAT
ncbi:MAG: hypothetical protein Q7J60_03915 [Bradyrhizobium sp.]|nr:hypothetical protein [Bradyrhizobium sp.]